MEPLDEHAKIIQQGMNIPVRALLFFVHFKS